MTVAVVNISSTDRMSFTLFLAVVLHAIVLFGVGWSMHDDLPPSRSLEVTLAQYKSEKAPDEADFLAQANQEGSGTLEEKAELSTTELADFRDNVIREVMQQEQSSLRKPSTYQRDLVTTTGSSTVKAFIQSTQDDTTESNAPESEALSLWQRNMEIASLEAQLKEQKQAYAKRPRRRQLTAISAKEARDAYYLEKWRNKIEWTGNKNYPKLDVYGALTMLVAVKADGTVEKIRVLRSSGYPQLDQAAKSIVRQAAPFAPFPEEIRADTDILEIIRTWKFEKGQYISSY